MAKSFFNKLFPKYSNRRIFILWLVGNHVYGVIAILRSVICNFKLTGNIYPIKCLVYPHIKLGLKVHKSAQVTLSGKLHVETCWKSSGHSYIEVGKNAKFVIKNDFCIGQDVQIFIAGDASFICGGRKSSDGSGITSDTKILVKESVEIGEDTIIAWDCFISDSDWHYIKGASTTLPVYIGNHVWIAHGVSILKGSNIPNNSIVGSKSMVSKTYDTESILIAGIPATKIKENISWTR